jgi:hypothetical protein
MPTDIHSLSRMDAQVYHMQEPECVSYVCARVFLLRLDNDNLIRTRLPMRTNQEHQPFCRSLSILFSMNSITYKKYSIALHFLVDLFESM